MAAELFGPYALDELISQNRAGELFRANDTARDRTVALKRLTPELSADGGFRARFHRDVRLAARLSQPHVIPIYDFGEIDGRLYVDMRFVDGTDLATYLAGRGALPPATAVDLVCQIAAALDAAHAEGLVHRGVKPANVVLARGEPPFGYLVDFGISRPILEQGTDPDTTGPETTGPETTMPGPGGLTADDVSYAAPERFHPDGDGLRVDVYGLACVLYEALTGTRPYSGDVEAVVSAHAQAPIPRPTQQRPGVPSGFDDVIARGMAKQPESRFASAGELATAARAALGTAPLLSPSPALAGRSTPTAPYPVTNWYPPQQAGHPGPSLGPAGPHPGQAAPPRRRRPLMVAAIVACTVLALIAAGIVTVVLVRSAAGPPSACSASATGGENPVVATIPIPNAPAELALSPDGSRVYAAGAGSFTIIDPSNNMITGTIPAGHSIDDLAIAPDGRRAYLLADFDLKTLDLTNNLITSPGADTRGARAMALSPDGTRAYLLGITGLEVIDTSNYMTLANIELDNLPDALAITPDGRRVYITDPFSGIVVVDTATNAVTGTIAIDGAQHVTVSPDGRRAYAIGYSGMTVLDTATNALVGTITVEGAAAAAISPDGRRLYLFDGSQSLTVVDTASNVRTATIPLNIDGVSELAINPNGCAYAASSKAVHVINVAGR